jgi:hypothetical protein
MAMSKAARGRQVVGFKEYHCETVGRGVKRRLYVAKRASGRYFAYVVNITTLRRVGPYYMGLSYSDVKTKAMTRGRLCKAHLPKRDRNGHALRGCC